MPAKAIPPLGAVRTLVALAGRVTLTRVGLLMVCASTTEGIGLLLLVPITQIVAGHPVSGLSAEWSRALAALPLAVLLGGFVLLVALRAGLTFLMLSARHDFSLSLTRRLRTMTQDALIAAEWRWLSGQRSGDHAALIVGESQRVGALADRALDTVTSLVTLAALLTAALYLDWRLTAITALLGLLAGGFMVLTRRRRAQLGDPFAAAYEALHAHVAEGLTHLRAARIAGAQRELAERFDAIAQELRDVELAWLRAVDVERLGIQVVAAIVLACLAWFALAVLAVPLALFVPVLAIFLRIVPLAGNLQNGVRSWQFCRPALANLLATVEEARGAAEPGPEMGEPLALATAIELSDISLSYPDRDRPVFDRFSHRIEVGSLVGVTGPSGSGKSTLADLLSGLVAPDAGQILVDGAPLIGADRIRWRRQVAYVEQSPYLFDGTIAENVAWGNLEEVDRAAVEQALEEASAGFVRALPEGIDTLVGERGRELSGGERQRIALARALLRQPSLLILDEVSAALDSDNEQAITRTLAALRGRTTCVVLSHRAALLRDVDDLIELGAA